MKHSTEINIELWKRGVVSELPLTPKQMECIEVIRNGKPKEVVYGGAAGGGKTWMGVELFTILCLAYPNTKWFIGRKSLKDLRGSVTMTMKKVCKSLGVDMPKFNGVDMWFIFENGSQIDYKELRYLPADPMYERLGSIEYTGGWIEEGGEAAFDAYDTLKSRIGRHLNMNFCNECGTYHEAPTLNKEGSKLYCSACRAWKQGLKSFILTTCNPKKNWLYKLFYKPFKAKELDSKKAFIPALATDNKHIGSEYIENLKSITDKAKKARLLDGDWEYDDDPYWLIKDYDTLLAIFDKRDVQTDEQYITCDAARFGSDAARIGRWIGMDLVEAVSFDVSRTTDISAQINQWIYTHNIPTKNVVVDADGVGGGVVDEVGGGCVSFVNNSTAIVSEEVQDYQDSTNAPIDGTLKRENYGSLKDQCGFKLAEVINAYKLVISADLGEKDRAMLIEELEHLKRRSTDGKLKLKSKDDVKADIGHSPDWSDLLLFRMWFEIAPVIKPRQLYW